MGYAIYIYGADIKFKIVARYTFYVTVFRVVVIGQKSKATFCYLVRQQTDTSLLNALSKMLHELLGPLP